MRRGRVGLSRRELFRGLAAGAIRVGLDGRFSAAEETPEKPELSFGVLADTQYADARSWVNRQYRASAGKLAECVKELNKKKLDFTIQLGDLIDRDFASFKVVCPLYDKLTMPHYHVLGNHDFSVSEATKPKVLRALGLDRLGTKKGHYDFTVGRWRFVVLNGTDVSRYANPPGSRKHEQAKAMMDELRKGRRRNLAYYNGAIGDEQIRWLTGALGAAAKADQRVILFCHMPIFPDGAHNLYNDTQVLAIIDKHPNVVAYLAGHRHAGNYASRKGVHYLTVKGMVETHFNSFGIMEVYSDRLRLIGFGRETNRTMHFGDRYRNRA